MDLKDLVLRIKGDSSGAESALGNVGAATNKFGGIVKTIIAGAAVAAVVSFGKSCINAAAESQSAEVLLRSSLGNIKGMTDANKDAAVAWVNSMESSKSFDDAEIGAALQRLTLKTGSLKDAQDMTNTAMEVARNKNISLEAATTLVDGAYNGMTRTLKTFGIEVGPDGKPLKGMEAIHAIQEKVKGSGDAWSKTLEGQRQQFKTTFGNFQESVGMVLMPIAEKFMNVIQPFLQKAMSWIADHMPQIKAVMDTIIKGISWVVETAGKMYTAMKPFIVSITETLGPYITKLFTWLSGGETGGAAVQKVFVGVASAIGFAFKTAADIIAGIIDIISGVVNAAQTAITWIKNMFSTANTNQGGVYAPAANTQKGGVYAPADSIADTKAAAAAAAAAKAATAAKNLAAAKALASQSFRGHASGGWVGVNGPEIALVGEQGPEKIIPAGQSTGNDRAILNRLDDLITAVTRVAPGVSSAINGLGVSR